MMTIYKTAKVKNGTIHIGDKVTRTKEDGSTLFHGTVKFIYRTGMCVTLVTVSTPKGEMTSPANLLFKEC